MKALAAEMADAVLASPETGYERSLERARAEVTRTKSAMKALNAEMKANPRSFELYGEHARAARMHVSALRRENERLMAESRELGREIGLRELAADSEKLQAGLRESAERVDTLAMRAKEAETRFA
jgi:predicted RNase H-like nuclease (RuvC/YqgF family)